MKVKEIDKLIAKERARLRTAWAATDPKATRESALQHLYALQVRRAQALEGEKAQAED